MTVDPPTPTGTAGAALLLLELSDPAATPPPAPDPSAPGRPIDLTRPSMSLVTDQPGNPLGGIAEVLDHLNPTMVEFVRRMEMAFVATSDADGECDSSLRTGPPGFIEVLNDRTIAYPEYRDNGALGDIGEDARIGVLLVDFGSDMIGLHVNGTAGIVEDAVLRGEYPALPVDAERGRAPERWVLVHVVEAYIHRREHVPRLVPVDRTRICRSGDLFDLGVRSARRDSTATPA